MLSVFITPWMNPTAIHFATSDACAPTTNSYNASDGTSASAASGTCRAIAWPASDRSSSTSPVADAYWNVPTRRWLDATRASTAPGTWACRPSTSRTIDSPVATTASERVVGMPSACIASLIKYSRSIGPTAARPSPPRANGVRPDPLRCRSRRAPSSSTNSPSNSARPSPSRGEYPPNWWPA